MPGGGTTDYAVEIFYSAVKSEKYTCFVREDTILPMMYMPDCIKATMDLMVAPFDKLKHHSNFNVSALSFTAGELAEEIKKYKPDFECEYRPDFRQAIADSWTNCMDDSAARKEWGWSPVYDLASMTQDMLMKLERRRAKGEI
jgi:nucleoside-diphosphate-sugar epimerase